MGVAAQGGPGGELIPLRVPLLNATRHLVLCRVDA